MNKMKKALLLALSLAMSATLFAACGKDKGGKGDSSSSSESSSVSTPVESDSSDESSDSSDESSESSDESSESSDVSSESSEDSSDSSSEPEVVTYAFTKVINPKDFMNGRVTVELEEGTALDLTAPDDVEGKTFKGWLYVDLETGETTPVEAGATMGTAPVVIYADWELTEYTVTITLDGEAYKTLTFAVEGNYEGETPIFGLQELDFNVSAELPKDTKEVKYTVVGIPTEEEGWKLQNYTLDVTSEVVDDDDLAGTIKYFDRLNKNVMNGKEQGVIKENKYNYWDGSESSVSVVNQKDVTNGSDFALKVSLNVNNLTADELANVANGTWADWNKKDMWVGFAIPVGGMDLTNYELIFDMKMDNMRTGFIVYAASDYEGEGAAYAVDKSKNVYQADAEDLGDGWYRYTIEIDCSWGVGTAADYIVLSMDNTGADVDNTKDSIAYIDNMSLNEIIYYTVSLDGEEEVVREGTMYTPEVPKKDGFKFLGWKDADGNYVDGTFEVTTDVTLTSDWEELPLQMALYQNIYVNLGNADYKVVSFTAEKGVYNIEIDGNIYARALNEDGTVGEKITQIEFTEAGEQRFVIHFDEDTWDNTGMVMMSKEDSYVRYSIWRDDQYLLETSTDMTAPLGYDSITEFDWSKQTYHLYDDEDGFSIFILSNNDISMYTDLYFAIKMTGSTAGYYIGGGKSFVNDGWVYIHLAQAADATWSLTYTLEDGTSVELFSGYHGLNDKETVPTLRGLIGYKTPTVSFLPKRNYATDKDVHIYMTEVVGIKDPNYVEPEVPVVPDVEIPVVSENATAILDKDTGKADTLMGSSFTVLENVEISAPEGYETVMGFEKALAANTNESGFKGIQLGDYKEVWFAVKVVGGRITACLNYNTSTQFYVDFGTDANGWVYFHLTQHDEKVADKPVWTIEVVGSKSLILDDQQPLQYNSLAKILLDRPANVIGGNVTEKFGTDDDIFMFRTDGTSDKLTIYATEIRAVKKGADQPDEPEVPDTPDYDPEIAENAAIVADSLYVAGNNLATYEGTSVAAPNGFDKVTTLFSANGNTWASNILGSADYAYVDITKYSELWFAVMVENGRISHTPSYASVDSDNETVWIYFHATKDANGTWTVEITKNGTVWKTLEGQQAVVLGSLFDISSDGDRIVVYQKRDSDKLSNADVYVYMTEVVGVEMEKLAFDTQIDEKASRLFNSVLAEGKGEFVENMEIPAGFNLVSKHSYTTQLSPADYFTKVDVSEYSDLYFAMRQENGKDIYLQGYADQVYAGSEWLYVYLHQEDDGTWTKSVRAAYGFEWIEGKKGLTGTTIAQLCAYAGSGVTTGSGTFPRHFTGTPAATAYFTDVLAIRKDGAEIPAPELPGQPDEPEVPVEPEVQAPVISEDATLARAYIWRDDKYNLKLSAEAAPESFSTVYEYDWDKYQATATGLPSGTLFDKKVDISNYSELYFAVKMKNQTTNGIYVRTANFGEYGNGQYYDGGNWLYAYYKKDAATGTWSLSLTTADGYVGIDVQTGIVANNLNELVAYNVKSDAKPWDGGFYPTKASSDAGVFVYYTEVLGVVDNKNAVVVDSAITGAVASDAVVGMGGYANLYTITPEKTDANKYTYDLFADVDVSGYETLSFGIATEKNFWIKKAGNNMQYFMDLSPLNGHTFADIGYANIRGTVSSVGSVNEVKLVNNGDGTWTVTINTTVHYDPICDTNAGCTDQGTTTVASYTTTVSGTTLKEIMASVIEFRTDNYNGAIYCTEVRGVAKVVEAE